ncbi:MAG: discoidin domain-containing protein [Halopseudomonas sp.]|uniref:discoidin domain-containing protein n=1 Tax=Halopseudomonas sp. TaxID=2901191 RepID=UPI0030021FB6
MSEDNLLGGVLQAQVRVESLPAARQIVAVERQLDGTWRVCGNAQSGVDGLADLTILAQSTSDIYALAVDDWGQPWESDLVVAVGGLVRPTNFTGWLYRVTQSGTLPTAEPEWWNSSSMGPQPVGDAALEAERYYQPIAHGPLPIELSTGLTYRYWRVAFQSTRDAGSFKAAIAEIEFKLTGKVVGGSAFSSSDLGDGYEASVAFDGLASTSWTCASGSALPQWVGFMFDDSVDVSEVSLRAGDNAIRANRAPAAFVVECSSDGITWVERATFSEEPAWGVSESRTWMLN